MQKIFQLQWHLLPAVARSWLEALSPTGRDATNSLLGADEGETIPPFTDASRAVKRNSLRFCNPLVKPWETLP